MSAGDVTQGRHREVAEGNDLPIDPVPGDYWWHDGQWWCFAPRGGIGGLRNHTITQHEDGTITVSPSILIQGSQEWHGYLEHGVWREV